MVVNLRVHIALHDIILVVPIVCACPAAWGIGDLHQTAAVEEEPFPSAVGSKSPGAVELVKTGLYLGPCANVVVNPRGEIALHDSLLGVPIVCACTAAAQFKYIAIKSIID